METYLCPSYVDDDGVLRDCKCGKCAAVLKRPMSREELQEAICDVMNIYPSELEHNLPNSFGNREMEDMLNLIDQYAQQVAIEAEVRGMNKARSRVLRRTEIPADAKNPTRDYVVVLGEEIAGFIDQDIAELEKQKETR